MRIMNQMIDFQINFNNESINEKNKNNIFNVEYGLCKDDNNDNI